MNQGFLYVHTKTRYLIIDHPTYIIRSRIADIWWSPEIKGLSPIQTLKLPDFRYNDGQSSSLNLANTKLQSGHIFCKWKLLNNAIEINQEWIENMKPVRIVLYKEFLWRGAQPKMPFCAQWGFLKLTVINHNYSPMTNLNNHGAAELKTPCHSTGQADPWRGRERF